MRELKPFELLVVLFVLWGVFFVFDTNSSTTIIVTALTGLLIVPHGAIDLALARELPWIKNSSVRLGIFFTIYLILAVSFWLIWPYFPLRDVGEDSHRGRIYLPLEDLALFDYTEAELFKGVIDDRWRTLMQFQIQRARKYYDLATKGISYLIPDARWPVWTALMQYQGILDVIEHNQYDVFNQRAFVSTPKKILYLPLTWLRAQVL